MRPGSLSTWIGVGFVRARYAQDAAQWKKEAERLANVANQAGGSAVLLALKATDLKEGTVDIPKRIVNEVAKWQAKPEDGPRGSRRFVVSKRG